MKFDKVRKAVVVAACLIAITVAGVTIYQNAQPTESGGVPRVAPRPTQTPVVVAPPRPVIPTRPARIVPAELQPIARNAEGKPNYHLMPKINDMGRVLRGHSGCVLAMALSPDGKTLASAASDQTVRLWDWDAGKLRRRLEGLTGSPMAMAYSGDGKSLAVGQRGGQIVVWDGPAQIRRASHVSPVRPLLRLAFFALRWAFGEKKGRVAEWTRSWKCLWRVDLGPSGGDTYEPFEDRAEAIAFEVEWLKEHLPRRGHG